LGEPGERLVHGHDVDILLLNARDLIIERYLA